MEPGAKSRLLVGREGERECSRLRLQHQQRAGATCPVLRRPDPRLVAEERMNPAVLMGDRMEGEAWGPLGGSDSGQAES